MRASAPHSESGADSSSCGASATVTSSGQPTLTLIPPPSAPLAPGATTPPRKTRRASGTGSGNGRIGSGNSSAGRETRGLQKVEAMIAQGQTDKAIVQMRKLLTDLPHATRGQVRIASLLHERRQSVTRVCISEPYRAARSSALLVSP